MLVRNQLNLDENVEEGAVGFVYGDGDNKNGYTLYAYRMAFR